MAGLKFDIYSSLALGLQTSAYLCFQTVETKCMRCFAVPFEGIHCFSLETAVP